jgi:hypothetical protein
MAQAVWVPQGRLGPGGIPGYSPPRLGVHHGHRKPHAIVIPTNRMSSSLRGMAHAGSRLSVSSNGGKGGGNGWFMVGQSQSLYVSFFLFLRG